MKPIFKELKYIGYLKNYGHKLDGLLPNKKYKCTLTKICGVHNYWIINEDGKEILISNNLRRKYFKSYK